MLYDFPPRQRQMGKYEIMEKQVDKFFYIKCETSNFHFSPNINVLLGFLPRQRQKN